MTLGGFYKTGTISIDTGDDPRIVTGTDTLWASVAEVGDWLIADGSNGFGLIETVDGDMQLTLSLDWNGGDLEDAGYALIKNSWLRYDPAITQAQVRKLIEALTGDQTVFYRIAGAVPDPSLGEDGDFAIKTNDGAWQQWEKVSGVWEALGSPVGTNWKGPWSSVVEYLANDQVEDDGASYTALVINTNKRPSLNSNPANPSREWDLSAARGLPGIAGGVITIPLVFDGASTADSDPGDGKIRFGPAATQRQAGVWRVDLSDSDGLDWSGTFTDLAAGTSTIKFKARLFKRSDQTVRIVGNVTAVATPSGYRNFTFAATDWSSDNPFSNLDEVALALAPKGDKGDTGSTGAPGAPGGTGLTGATGQPGEQGVPGDSFDPDYVVNEIDDRDDYDDEPVGTSVLVVSDSGNDNKPTLYFIRSLSPTVWSDPITWVPEAGAGFAGVEDRPSNGSISAIDKGKLLKATDTITLLFAQAVALGNDFFVYIKATNGNVTLTFDGAETVDGVTSLVIPENQGRVVFCNGTTFTSLPLSEGGGADAETDVASAATCDIGGTNTEGVRITGTTTITSFGTRKSRWRRIRFADKLVLTHNGTSLILPNGGADIVTATGDTCFAVSDTAGNWRVIAYQKVNGQAIGLREKLVGNRTYYVRQSDGSDNNDGLTNTSSGAFQSLQKALNVVAGQIDFAGNTVTIQLGDGTYSVSGNVGDIVPWIGAGVLVIQGNNSTPSNVILSAAGGNCIHIARSLPGDITIKDLKVTTASSGNGIFAQASCLVRISGIDFGSCVTGHINISAGTLSIVGPYTISAGATRHYIANPFGFISPNGSQTVTLSGTPAFSTAFAQVNFGYANLGTVTFSGSATGSRYQCVNNGIIVRGGDTLPGNSAGSTSSGGQYS